MGLKWLYIHESYSFVSSIPDGHRDDSVNYADHFISWAYYFTAHGAAQAAIDQVTFDYHDTYSDPQTVDGRTFNTWSAILVPDTFQLPTAPDLTIKLDSMSPTTLSASTPLKISLTVHNSGTTAAHSTVGIYISDDPIIDTNDTLVVAGDLGTLNGKSTSSITWTGKETDFAQPVSPGKHYIGAIVDYKNLVGESSESNNTSKAILINVAGSAPDLKVKLDSVGPTNVDSDGSLDLKYTISNAGNADAGDSQVAFYISKDATIDKGDTKWFWGDEPTPSAGKSDGHSLDDFPLFDIVPAGKYYIGAIIDNDDRITESDETNNSSNAIAITITGANLDPIANDDVATTDYRTPVKIDILANDSDPNPGDKLSYVVAADSSHYGSVKINADKTITYTPEKGFVGVDHFTYTLSDDHGGHAEGKVDVTVDWRDPMVNKGVLSAKANPYDWDFLLPEAAVDGTYTFKFEVTKPTTMHGIINGGPNVDAKLLANPGNKAPTLGAGPDRTGSVDAGRVVNVDQQLIDDPLMPGKYSLVMTRHASTDFTGNAPEQWVNLFLTADEAGNRIEWAAPLAIGATVKGVVDDIDNKDIFKFTLTKQSSVLVSLAVDGVPIKVDGVPPIHYEIVTKAGSTDYYHVLESHIDAASRWVDTAYTAPDLDDPNNTPLPAGDYYVIVYHPEDIKTLTAPPSKYSVTVNSWIDNAANRPLVEDFGAEGPKSANIGDLTGKHYHNHDFLGLADRNDFYIFTLTERSSITIKLTQASKDVSMNLDLSTLPDVGDPNAVIDGVREGAGPRTIIVTLDPGMYTLRAYTDTDFSDPGGSSKYGTPLVLPKHGGAFYDLDIAAKTAGLGATAGSATSDDWLGGDGNDLFNSGSGNDILRGWAGNDNINGGVGDDIVVGGAGADTLAGGGGKDTLSYAGAGAGVTVSLEGAAGLGGSVQTIVVKGGDAEGDKATGFLNVIGGSGSDALTGDSGNNVLAGGGSGDILAGGDGFDILSYAGSKGAVTVNLAANSASGGDATGDTISGFEGVIGGLGNDRLTGDDNGNILDGGAGDDVLSGAAGNDTLTGGAGDDTVQGGPGNDVMTGGSNAALGDTLSYADDTAGVTVSLAISKAQQTGGEGTDTVSGFENLTGGSGNDLLTGDKNFNLLSGGAGDDVIVGAAGFDTLTGGTGNDLFRFLAPADGADDITDFNNTTADDKISIVKAGFGLAAANDANFISAGYFVSETGHAPTVAHAQLLFDTATHELWFDSDGVGAKAAVLIATFSNDAVLQASDFELK